MARVTFRIDTCSLNPLTDNQAYSLARKSVRSDPIMTVNGPEQRPFLDIRSGQPLFHRSYWTPSTPTVWNADFTTRTILVCFGTAEGDFEALTNRDHIFAVKADQLRPPEATCET